jgi:hypothetical protein
MDRRGQNWTELDRTGQKWTEMDIAPPRPTNVVKVRTGRIVSVVFQKIIALLDTVGNFRVLSKCYPGSQKSHMTAW